MVEMCFMDHNPQIAVASRRQHLIQPPFKNSRRQSLASILHVMRSVHWKQAVSAILLW